MKAESTLFSRYFVSVSMTITKVVHIWVALHMHKVLLKCDLTSTFFLMQLSFSEKETRKKKFSVLSESTSRDQGGTDEQGWVRGISVVLLFNIKPQCKVAKASQFKLRKKGDKCTHRSMREGKSSLIKTNSRISAHTSN